MYQYVWNKFLPVIALKLKTAVKKREPQLLEIDKLDFERASDKKNSKYQFKLVLNEGRAIRSKDNSAIALDFARALNEYDSTKEIVKTGSFKFNMNTKFVLSIEATLPPLAAEAQAETQSVTPVEAADEPTVEAQVESPAVPQAEIAPDALPDTSTDAVSGSES